MSVTTPSKLQKMIVWQHFAVTSEVGPPRSADGAVIELQGNLIQGLRGCHQRHGQPDFGLPGLQLACCIRLKLMGLEPCLQMVTRDRNRIALRAISWGTTSSASHNILCLTGDHQHFGDHPKCANVFDLDSIQLIQTVRMMRDEGKLLGGHEFAVRPQMSSGAAANLPGPRGHAGVTAGQESGGRVQFVQTAYLQHGHVQRFMKLMVDRGLHEKVAILAGSPRKTSAWPVHAETVPGMMFRRHRQAHLAASPGKAGPKRHHPGGGADPGTERVEGVRGFPIMAIEWKKSRGNRGTGRPLSQTPVGVRPGEPENSPNPQEAS